MLTRFLALLITLAVLSPMVIADDNFLVVVDNQSGEVQKTLTGFPGRCWGKTADKVYLAGGEDEISWLRARHIDFDAVRFDDETSFLYLWYLDKDRLPVVDFEILDYGPGYILTSVPPKEAIPFRRLSLRSLPFTTRDLSFDRILEFDPYIDSLINEVSQDTLIDFLSGLSGETPVVVNGQLDTIRTRYSGEPDNFLAAEYLKEKLENYGYVVEYHQFFGGGMRHTAAYDENLAWVVSEGSQAFRTTDGGATWQMMPDNTSSSLWGVTNVGPDSVWIVGNNGVILFSSDGGDSFVQQNSGTGYFLFGVCFINSAEGWVAGDAGRILHTSNSGQNWSTQPTPTGSRLYDVCFVDAQYGWAVGRSGTIIHTDNGGASWVSQTSNTSERLYSVDFVDRENGWAVGWDGVVRHTTDGGTTWQTVNLGSYNYKYHVDFPDLMHGCIVGWDGEIFVTTDGGTTWQQKSSGTSKDFYGIEFVDSLTGFAVGGGIIEKTTDGGETWVNQTGGIEGAWRNVIATKTGAVHPDQEVIICGHFDDTSEQPEVRAPGADDNGSGSVAVVDAARIFAGVDFERTVKFCLWNGEEQGLLGSAAYAEEAYARGDDILGVFNFDMIAWDGNHDGDADLHCGTMSSSIALGEILEGVITDYGLDLDPELITFGSSGASDHASFWDYNYPAMLGIEDFDDFNPFYHTTSDNLSNIMPDYFTEFVKAAVGAAATFAVPTAEVMMTCENLTPSFCRGTNFYFKLTVNNPTGGNVSGVLTFTGYAGYDCNAGNELVTVSRSKSYAPGTTQQYYFFRAPNAAQPGQYSASVSGSLGNSEVYCCMNTDIIQCQPWRIGDNTEWELVQVDRPEAILPTVTELYQNHPNPFNASTTVSYQLATAGQVTLEVYNLLGQRVTTLVNEKQQARYGSVVWDASELSSGLYFYKLTAGNSSEVKRMTLLK